MDNTPKILFALRPAGRCVYADCVERASYHELAICREHAAQAWKVFEDVEPESYKRVIRGEASEVAAEQRAAKAEAKQRKRYLANRPGTIYYVKVGDLLKIGFTTDLYQRMMHYPPNAELLATHPGTPAMEREMHARFVRYLAQGREWFEPSDQLAEHIANVQATYPLKATIAQMRQPANVPGSTLRPKRSTARRV